MQAQDYLPYFQNLLTHWYHFTLANPAYAVCLAAAVWLLTAVFYSLRIGFLNRRNRINSEALLTARSGMAAAQQQIQELQEKITASHEQIEQAQAATEREAQRAEALQQRISRLGAQLTESIKSLPGAIDPVLSTNTLEMEELWERFGAAFKNLNKDLLAEQRSNSALQQAYDAETAKLAEKDSQLQALQLHLDSQSQQLAQLELTVAEYKTLLSQQQHSEQLRISEIETRQRADLARLAALEQQALDWGKTRQEAQQPPKVQETPIKQPEQAKPVEIAAIRPQAAAAEQIPQQIQVDTPPSVAEVPKQQPADTAGAVSGKLKNMFAGAMQKIGKLDEKLGGQNNPVPQQEEPTQTDRVESEASAIVGATHIEASIEMQQPQSQVKGQFGKLKSLFSSSKASPDIQDEEPLAAEPEQPQPAETADSDDTGKPIPGRLNRLFGKIKRNG